MGSCVSSDEASSSSAASSSSSSSSGRSKKSQKDVKILLLGTGQSGKSTIAKQLKILHLRGFTAEEVVAYRELIHKNVIEEMKILATVVSYLKIEVADDNVEILRRFEQLDFEQLTPDLAHDIGKLWRDEGVQVAFAKTSEFQLNDSAAYFFEVVDRIAAENYVPEHADILRARQMTTGVHELHFEMNGYRFTILDAGGQRSQRADWKSFFEGLDAFIFVVAISEYDMVLAEDKQTNRMQESLQVFCELCNSQVLQNAAVILFLNKRDIFAQKINKVPLTVCFPDYQGANEYKPASQYIKHQFANMKLKRKREIYAHLTCATDTTSTDKIFTSSVDSIISKGLSTAGVI
jgi:guanine nucleotide-binding protein G(i) subunit alpha